MLIISIADTIISIADEQPIHINECCDCDLHLTDGEVIEWLDEILNILASSDTPRNRLQKIINCICGE